MGMTTKVDQAAHIATQGGAAVAGMGYATFSMGWWNENSAGIVAMAATFGAACSGVGLFVSWYRGRNKVITK